MALQRSTVQTPLPKKPELLVNQKRMFWVESVILPGAFSWDLLCDAGWVQWWSRKERPQSELSQGTLQGCSGSCSSASVSLEAQAIPREHVWEANWVPPQTSPLHPRHCPTYHIFTLGHSLSRYTVWNSELWNRMTEMKRAEILPWWRYSLREVGCGKCMPVIMTWCGKRGVAKQCG